MFSFLLASHFLLFVFLSFPLKPPSYKTHASSLSPFLIIVLFSLVHLRLLSSSCRDPSGSSKTPEVGHCHDHRSFRAARTYVQTQTHTNSTNGIHTALPVPTPKHTLSDHYWSNEHWASYPWSTHTVGPPLPPRFTEENKHFMLSM